MRGEGDRENGDCREGAGLWHYEAGSGLQSRQGRG